MPNDAADVTNTYELREPVSPAYREAMMRGAMLAHNADALCAPAAEYDPYNTQPYAKPAIKIPTGEEYAAALQAGAVNRAVRDGLCGPEADYDLRIP